MARERLNWDLEIHKGTNSIRKSLPPKVFGGTHIPMGKQFGDTLELEKVLCYLCALQLGLTLSCTVLLMYPDKGLCSGNEYFYFFLTYSTRLAFRIILFQHKLCPST